MFKRSIIKSAWIEIIQNIKGKAKKWGSIEMTEKRWTTNEMGIC